jgi:hypothetical protein
MPRLDVNPPINFPRLFVKRGLLASLLVLGTYNPSGHSYFHWVTETGGSVTAKLSVGIVLFTGLVAVGRMAYLSMGFFGITAISLMVIMSVLAGVGLGFFAFDNVHVTIYFVLFWIILVLGIGISWGFVQKRIAGEREVLRSPP